MLDVKDLRIGNYVIYENRIGIIKWFTNKSFSLKMEFSTLNHTSRKGWAELPFEPIELTEEWLLRFGFVDDELQMSGHKWLIYKRPHLHKMDIRIAIPKSDNDWSLTLECVSPPTMTLAHLKYVHQLQNLYYALTNTELTLKDEK